MTEPSFEDRLNAAFAAAPPTDDGEAFTKAVMGQLAREARIRMLAIGLAGAGGLAVLAQTLVWTRDFPVLVGEWTASATRVMAPTGDFGAYAWMAAGLGLAAVALMRGVEA